MLKTSKNETMVPLGTTKNPGVDGSPVNPNDTQDEPDNGAAQAGFGATAIVFPLELDCPESIAVPELASGTVSAFIFAAKDRDKRRRSATQTWYFLSIPVLPQNTSGPLTHCRLNIFLRATNRSIGLGVPALIAVRSELLVPDKAQLSNIAYEVKWSSRASIRPGRGRLRFLLGPSGIY